MQYQGERNKQVFGYSSLIICYLNLLFLTGKFSQKLFTMLYGPTRTIKLVEEVDVSYKVGQNTEPNRLTNIVSFYAER